MSNKLSTVGIVVALALGIVGLFTGDRTVVNPTEVREVVKESVGAVAGNEFSNKAVFRQSFVDGGGCLATSTAATGNIAGTLTALQLERNNCISITINKQAGGSLALPASTTWSFLPNAGDTGEWFIDNATSSATAVLTVLAGTGINLVAVDTNTDVIDGTERMTVRCTRMPDTDIDCYVTELLDAD